MLVGEVRCDNPDCGNAGRYLCVYGATMCSLCAMKSGRTAVRISDLPHFIALAQVIAEGNDSPEAKQLRNYLPRNT